MQGLVNIATSAIRNAAEFVTRHQQDALSIAHLPDKSSTLMTWLEQQVTHIISEYIRKIYPHHTIIAAQQDTVPDALHSWQIGHIDGYANYLQGNLDYTLALSAYQQEEQILSIIYTPQYDQLFIAIKGNGAVVNEKRLRIQPKPPALSHSLIAMELPKQHDHTTLQSLTTMGQLSLKCRGIRQYGSVTLSMARVASGYVHAFYHHDDINWLRHPGTLLIQEAGAFMLNEHHQPIDENSTHIACGHEKLLSDVTPLLIPK